MIDFHQFDQYLFDLDDTLINTRDSYRIAQEFSIRREFAELSEERVAGLISNLRWMCGMFGSGNVKQYYSAFLENTPDDLMIGEQSLQTMLETYQTIFDAELKCFDGVFELLDLLLSQKRKIAVVSNGIEISQQNKLRRVGLRSYFPDSKCYISGKYPSELRKPSPHMVDLACKDSTISPERTVFVGNEISDCLAGNLANVTTVLVGEKPLPDDLPIRGIPDDQIKDIRSIADLYRRGLTTRKGLGDKG